MGFTRSTTDVKIHQSMSDYPRVEDGISAEELKKKFDAPAEQLQKDLNTLEKELEDKTGATSLGAMPLSDGDNSGDNVQAKLEYLLGQAQNAVQGQIIDGSITQSKLDPNFSSSIAYKNGELQENLNAEKINGKTDIELYRSMIKIGFYTGNSTESQTVEVGFKPSAVIICTTSKIYRGDGSSPQENIGIIAENGLKETYKGTNLVTYTGQENILTDNGFTVHKLKRTYDGEIQYNSSMGFNIKGTIYTYIAFR